MTVYAVHHYDQAEIKRIEDKAAMEIKLAKAEVARVEGQGKLAEEHWKAQVERYKQDVLLAYTEDYALIIRRVIFCVS